MNRIIATLLLVEFLFHGRPSGAVTFIALGDLPGDEYLSEAHAISAEGSAVVGHSYSSNGVEAFVWTRTNGIVGLGDFPGGPIVLDVPGDGFYSRATELSSDGAVITGIGNSASGLEAFRWTAAGGLVGLGPGTAADPTSGVFVSINGSVIAGNRLNGMKREAYRWTSAQGVTGVPNVSGDTLPSYASGISADGSRTIGARWSGQLGSSDQGFLAPQSGPRLDVGDLPGGQTFAGPLGISGDGLTVVGQSGVTNGVEAFRWTSAGGIVGLGDFTNGNRQSAAYAASQDGSVIVGSGMRPSNATAFRWSQSTGMQAVQDLLVEAGIDMQGWNLLFATDVSANGNTYWHWHESRWTPRSLASGLQCGSGTGGTGATNPGDDWLVSTARPGRIQSPSSPSTHETG